MVSMTSTKCQFRRHIMFINKSVSGDNNLCGKNIAQLRKALGISQRKLADRLQLQGLDIDKNAIQRIEAGKRFITDIELVAFKNCFDVSYEDLLEKNTD